MDKSKVAHFFGPPCMYAYFLCVCRAFCTRRAASHWVRNGRKSM